MISTGAYYTSIAFHYSNPYDNQFLADVPFLVPAAHEYSQVHAHHIAIRNAENESRVKDR